MTKFFAIILVLMLTSCANGELAEQSNKYLSDPEYSQWMNATVEKIKKTPSYRRIPIDTFEQQTDYIALSYQAYKQKISKQEFADTMNQKYPGYTDSVQWIVEQLPK